MIKVVNGLLSLEKINFLYEKLLYFTDYRYGEKDHSSSIPIGMISEIDLFYYKNFLEQDVFDKFDNLRCLKLNRSYVNLFMPNDKPFFHCDNIGNTKVLTCLIYVCPEYHIDEGGETQFYLNDEIKGIFPKPGRAILFDGSIAHKATSFRNNPRLTIALKYILE